VILLRDLSPAAEEAWWTLFELAEGGTDNWMVIGGQMVHLLAAEHGAAESVRPTQDADVVVNVRALQDGTEMVSAWLLERGFDLDGASPDGIGHRFVREASGGPGRTVFDVLAPEGVGERANLSTVRPFRTIEVPGSVQAFKRSSVVEVTVSGMSGRAPRSGAVRRPGLLGALIMKAVNTQIAGRVNSDRDWQDAALLLSLVLNPSDAAAACGNTDRRRLRYLLPLRERDHIGWANLDDEAYRRGLATLELSLETPMTRR